MADRKTDAQKLEDLDKRLSQLKQQKKAIEARSKKKERTERTHRLIQNGALAEKYLQADNIAPADLEKLLSRLVQLGQVKDILGSFKSPIGGDENGQSE